MPDVKKFHFLRGFDETTYRGSVGPLVKIIIQVNVILFQDSE